MLKFWLDLSMLGFEAQQVIWLRSIGRGIVAPCLAGIHEAVELS